MKTLDIMKGSFFCILAILNVNLIEDAIADNKLNCPEGSEYISRASTKKNAFVEYCIDENGKKNGLLRLWENDILYGEANYKNGSKEGGFKNYDEKGMQLSEVIYENDKEVSFQITTVYLEEIVRDRNADAIARGRKWQMNLIDRNTLEYDIEISWFKSLFSILSDGTISQEKMEKIIVNLPEICTMFNIEGTEFNLIKIKYSNKKGKILMSGSFTKDDCSLLTDLLD